MTSPTDRSEALRAAIAAMPAPASGQHELGTALFVGSGDSLSACLLATAHGHHAASAGDVAWTGSVPPRIDTVVGVSHSGRTTATVEALAVARRLGLATIAVTVNADAAITTEADAVVVAADVAVDEVIPAAGFLSLSRSVLALLGATDAVAAVPAILDGLVDRANALLAALPSTEPAAISVLTLPDLRTAGDFWMLKLIEATGLAVRAVALEESGHVDYFVGPQSHLVLDLVGTVGVARHERLARALADNGQHVGVLDVSALEADAVAIDLAVAALGAFVAEEVALLWGRPPFRNHEVPMDARHIQTLD